MSDSILSIQNLSKSFGAICASEDISLDLHACEIHALIGPNGAGKSTLIAQLAGEIPQDHGAIFLGGQEISNLDTVARANAGLARSFQVSSVVPNFSALQNVMLAVQGNQGRTFKFFKPVLRDVELVDNARTYLQQVELEGRANVSASDLSHGERRKLELAMALALEPKVFLLDEPMAGLGAEGSKAMTALLADLKHKAPILLVEHDMDAVFALADRISVLVYGRIIATGTVEDIRNNPDVREAYLGSESL